MNYIALSISLLSGLSFVLGLLIKKLIPNKNKLISFSLSMAFVVLIGISIFDLLPEAIETIGNIYKTILLIVGGFIFLKLFDLFMPDHEHKNNNNHKEHISTLTFLAIILHNIIECTLLYTISTHDASAGLFMALGISCHNIPLSIEVMSLTKNNKKELLMTILLVLSSILGGLLIGIFNINITEYYLGILTSITLGMIIYIVFFELLCEIKENIKKRSTIYGFICGVALIILLIFVIE